ncbi:MAG: hypothetical protein HC901_01235 [Bdellovibrionaceae bacterium]|nr:hypothetical protein [Pseudobdellovibrionaceae bacterium]
MKLKCYVNGELASDFDGAGILDDEAHQNHRVGRHGHIALQLHRRDELRAQFKDILIK